MSIKSRRQVADGQVVAKWHQYDHTMYYMMFLESHLPFMSISISILRAHNVLHLFARLFAEINVKLFLYVTVR